MNKTRRPRVRWGWITAVALGWLLGLNLAAWLGVTGARLGPPDAFDLGEVSSTLGDGALRPVAAAPRFPPPSPDAGGARAAHEPPDGPDGRTHRASR